MAKAAKELVTGDAEDKAGMNDPFLEAFFGLADKVRDEEEKNRRRRPR